MIISWRLKTAVTDKLIIILIIGDVIFKRYLFQSSICSAKSWRALKCLQAEDFNLHPFPRLENIFKSLLYIIKRNQPFIHVLSSLAFQVVVKFGYFAVTWSLEFSRSWLCKFTRLDYVNCENMLFKRRFYWQSLN